MEEVAPRVPLLAGDYLPGATLITGPKGTSAAIAMGDVVMLDSTNHVWVSTPASAAQIGPFGVASRAAATADTTVSVIIEGRAYVTADGVIHPVHYVMNSASTVGRVIEWASDVSALGTAGVNSLKVIGQYEGHETEGDQKTLPTNSAATDVVRVTLGVSG